MTSLAKSILFTINSIDIKNSINNITQRDKCNGDYLEVNICASDTSTSGIFRNADNKIIY